jgi:hypothetical protein
MHSSLVTLEPWRPCLLLTVSTHPSRLTNWSDFRVGLLMSWGRPNTEPRSDHWKTPFSVARCLLSRIIPDGAVLLRVCVAMGMLLHSNEHPQISTVADRLSMFATCGRIPWKATTASYPWRFNPCKEPLCVHWAVGLMGPIAGLDDMEKINLDPDGN